MSEEILKKTNPPGDDTGEFPQGQSSEQKPPTYETLLQTPPQAKPSGAGFMGRRGTAPIRIKEPLDNHPPHAHGAHSEMYDSGDMTMRQPSYEVPEGGAHATRQEHQEERGSEQHFSTEHSFLNQAHVEYLEKNEMEATEEDVYDLSQEPPAPPPPPSFAEKLFRGMNKVGFLILLLLFALHGLLSIVLPSAFFYAEEAVISTFQSMAATGQWVIPTDLNVSVMPGYYWFMALIALIPMPASLFLPMLAWISAFIALTGTYVLARCLLPKATRGAVPFMAGLILLTSPAFVSLGHMVIPEVLTAGFFAFALAFLYRGWTSNSGYTWFFAGFLFTALATFVGGPLPFLSLICGSIILVLWRTTLGRAHQLDAVMGFSCLVVLLSMWLVVVILLGGEGAKSLDSVLLYFAAPFMPPYWPLPQSWLTLVLFLALGLLPWTTLPIFVNWFRVIASSVASLKASRKDNSGPAWAWITLVIACAVLLRQEHTSLMAATPLLPIVVFLFATALHRLSSRGSRVFFLFVAVLFLAAGAVLTFVSIPATASIWSHLVPPLMKDVVFSAKGLPLVAGILLLGSLLLLKFTRREFVGGSLLMIVCMTLILVQPMTMLVAPSVTTAEKDNYLRIHPLGSGLIVLPYGLGAQNPVYPSQDTIMPVSEDASKNETGIPQKVTPETSSQEPPQDSSSDVPKDMPEEMLNEVPSENVVPQSTNPKESGTENLTPRTPIPAEAIPENPTSGSAPAPDATPDNTPLNDVYVPAAPQVTPLDTPAAQ